MTEFLLGAQTERMLVNRRNGVKKKPGTTGQIDSYQVVGRGSDRIGVAWHVPPTITMPRRLDLRRLQLMNGRLPVMIADSGTGVGD